MTQPRNAEPTPYLGQPTEIIGPVVADERSAAT